jgi:predicted O-methyltransferase YrrM
MDTTVLKVLEEVERVAAQLHTAGTFSPTTLRALARHATARSVRHSAETGSGASTLLFSQLSAQHTVFALDAGTNSIRAIQSSPLLRSDVVTFVEGPTQQTLPRHVFPHPLQLVLIDGPHGYPFPDLEYYYLYPLLDRDALLIVDDIHIPTITNMFDFIRTDAMFELQEVVETTAFFRRTSAPTFSTVGDGWWLQNYNRRAFEATAADPVPATAAVRSEQPTPCYLDQLGEFSNPLAHPAIRVHPHEPLAVAGWAIDVARRRPAEGVELVLDEISYRTAVRIARTDVATVHGDQAYVRCGFNTWLPADALTRGSHTLELRVILEGGRSYYTAARLEFEAA